MIGIGATTKANKTFARIKQGTNLEESKIRMFQSVWLMTASATDMQTNVYQIDIQSRINATDVCECETSKLYISVTFVLNTSN